MTEKKTANERIEEVVKEELNKANLLEEKETIFTKVKNAVTSETAKKVYGAMALGIAQGVMARLAFETLGELGSENETETIVEIEE